jgi:hypothetical protein
MNLYYLGLMFLSPASVDFDLYVLGHCALDPLDKF